jgi:hypothetical protein
MPEATNRRVRFVMYDANEWLHAMREVPRRDRSVWMAICNLQMSRGGPIPYKPEVIARHIDEDRRHVRASILRLISGGHLVDVEGMLAGHLPDIALSASSNYMKNKETGRKRAREGKKEEESLPYRQRDSSSNVRDFASASPRGGSAPSRPKNGKGKGEYGNDRDVPEYRPISDAEAEDLKRRARIALSERETIQ